MFLFTEWENCFISGEQRLQCFLIKESTMACQASIPSLHNNAHECTESLTAGIE